MVYAFVILTTIVIITFTYSLGFYMGMKQQKNEPCKLCGHKPSEDVTPDEITKEVENNFKELDALVSAFSNTWNATKHQIKTRDQEMYKKVIDAYLD